VLTRQRRETYIFVEKVALLAFGAACPSTVVVVVVVGRG
jgi:hypothetical protein